MHRLLPTLYTLPLYTALIVIAVSIYLLFTPAVSAAYIAALLGLAAVLLLVFRFRFSRLEQLVHTSTRSTDEPRRLSFSEQLEQMLHESSATKRREVSTALADTQAEIDALQSQINPHFLFNALESIRMRSLLKEENETADMVEKLAIMQRQYVDWGNDSVEIEQELEFVKAYLSLQKYRFGDRLNYNLEIDPECAQIRIPKLTIVTFVENACVHGIESKASPGWIFVRAYKREEQLYIEIEDTGSGIEEQKLYQMQHDMQNADIEMLKNKKSVGMLNACLRLKMYTEDHVCFEIEGEEGVGTWITICIPMEYLSFAEGCVNGPVCKRGKEIC